MRSVSTPDKGFAGAEKARRFIEKRIDFRMPVIIKTYGSDKYERYLVDVLYLDKKSEPGKILAEGRFLNQDLLDAGLAVRDAR